MKSSNYNRFVNENDVFAWMNNVVGIVDTTLKVTANSALNVMAKGLEKPMPQSLDWRVMHTRSR